MNTAGSGLGRLFAVAAISLATARVAAADCEPSYRKLGFESAPVGHLTVETSWVLIGCRLGLEEMPPAAVARAKAILAADVAKDPWGLLKFESDRMRRQALVRQLRVDSPDARIGDVFLLHWKVEE